MTAPAPGDEPDDEPGDEPGHEPGVGTALILAAGFGTRLRPLTEERPKPLVEVLGAPLVSFALETARRAGAKRIALNTHHLHPALQEALGERFFDIPLTFSYEPTILGTGGGIRQMAERLGGIDETFLVLNADALIDLDVRALIAAHKQRAALATLALRAAPDAARYGLIGTDEEERVRTFAGRTRSSGPVVKERMFCGVHVLEPEVLERLPLGEESCIARVGYPPLIDEGAPVLSFDVDGYFCDVGTPERLLLSNLELLAGKARFFHFDPFARFSREGERYLAKGALVHGRAELYEPVLIDDGAVVEADARIGPYAVVGKGAHVEEGAFVERAVLQSGARLVRNERLSCAVLSPSCRMDVDPARVREVLEG